MYLIREGGEVRPERPTVGKGRPGIPYRLQQGTRDTLRSQIALDKLERIAERARRYPHSVFTTLCHHIDTELLTDAFYALRRDSAAGWRL